MKPHKLTCVKVKVAFILVRREDAVFEISTRVMARLAEPFYTRLISSLKLTIVMIHLLFPINFEKMGAKK